MRCRGQASHKWAAKLRSTNLSFRMTKILQQNLIYLNEENLSEREDENSRRNYGLKKISTDKKKIENYFPGRFFF